MTFKKCIDCVHTLRKREIIYIDDKYIIIPKNLYLCSDCYEKHYIYNRDKITHTKDILYSV